MYLYIAVLIFLTTVSRGFSSSRSSSSTLVFQNDEKHCYRIPSIVQTNDGTLVAFAESRDGTCSDGNARRIAMKTSTDGGKTFDENVTIAVGNESYWVGNPATVYTKSGKIVLVYVKHGKGCVGDCGIGNGVVFSEDNGVTWSDPLDLSNDFGIASGAMPVRVINTYMYSPVFPSPRKKRNLNTHYLLSGTRHCSTNKYWTYHGNLTSRCICCRSNYLQR